ncbi:MAG: PHP domain-containing protein, partial [Oscillospiraceae bacterium]|nr:PHP domain-containing protein [Oscillospiraceae bacterium]
MKPKISVVFSQFEDAPFSGTAIDRIKISRINRSMNIILESAISPEFTKILSDGIKESFHLNSVVVKIKERMSAIKKAMDEMLSEGSTDEKQPKTLSEVLSINDKNEKSGSSAAKNVLAKSEKGDIIFGSPIHDDPVNIASIDENSGRVVVCGRVFNQEFKDIKNGEMHLGIFDMTDYKDSITVKFFIKNMSDNEYKNLQGIFKDGVKKKNLNVCVRGRAEFDKYANEVTIIANAVTRIKDPRPVREDNADKKRVELHLHTQMSAMDGVSSAADIIKRAVKFGHTAIAITDHGVAQSYPEAMHETNNSETIKVIYGVEGYLVDDSKKIIYDETD